MAGSDAAFTSAVELCGELKKKLASGDLAACGTLLGKLKIALTQFGFLPVGGSTVSAKELHLAREVLELGAQWGIKSGDVPAFERYMSQLKTYYFDFADQLAASPFQHELLGLNLLCLLSQNRIAEFHMELERISPVSDLQSNLYIRYPVALEQYLMEGAYNKVFLSKGNVPAETYAFFVDLLLDTVRDEIADCCERAYDSLPKSAAMRLLLLEGNDTTALADFAALRKWGQNVDTITFPKTEADATTVEATRLIERSLGYATELEKIV
eukprot:m.45056 g.45056  ORF g.45056 m.45056 type:complete len:269 (-) comp15111_c0_seq1:212-1018(-)